MLLQVGRADWSRNAAALTDLNWWKGTLKPRPAVDWYLDRVTAAVDDLKRQVDGAPITMLCHSVSTQVKCHTIDFMTSVLVLCIGAKLFANPDHADNARAPGLLSIHAVNSSVN